MSGDHVQLESTEQLDNIVEIVTPENIAFHYRLAGPFRRFVALLVDALAKGVTMYAFVIVVGLASSAFGNSLQSLLSSFVLILWFVLSWFYNALFETYWNGRTPGKWALGIRSLSLTGQPMNGMQATLRAILKEADMMPAIALGHVLPEVQDWPIAAFPVPLFFVGLLTMTLDRRGRRLGDLVAGTMVVMEDRSWLAGVAKVDDPRTPYLAELIPADFEISRTLGQALASYVDRRRFFTDARRREVARHLGEPLVRQFGLAADTSWDLLLCALYYRAFIAEPGEVTRGSEREQKSLTIRGKAIASAGIAAGGLGGVSRGVAAPASSPPVLAEAVPVAIEEVPPP